eukprot:ANDGO_07826.mRNA.1 hypothetical protein
MHDPLAGPGSTELEFQYVDLQNGRLVSKSVSSRFFPEWADITTPPSETPRKGTASAGNVRRRGIGTSRSSSLVGDSGDGGREDAGSFILRCLEQIDSLYTLSQVLDPAYRSEHALSVASDSYAALQNIGHWVLTMCGVRRTLPVDGAEPGSACGTSPLLSGAARCLFQLAKGYRMTEAQAIQRASVAVQHKFQAHYASLLSDHCQALAAEVRRNLGHGVQWPAGMMRMTGEAQMMCDINVLLQYLLDVAHCSCTALPHLMHQYLTPSHDVDPLRRAVSRRYFEVAAAPFLAVVACWRNIRQLILDVRAMQSSNPVCFDEFYQTLLANYPLSAHVLLVILCRQREVPVLVKDHMLFTHRNCITRARGLLQTQIHLRIFSLSLAAKDGYAVDGGTRAFDAGDPGKKRTKIANRQNAK